MHNPGSHLWSSDNHGSNGRCCREVLHDAEVFVAGPGRSVHNQVVQGAPVHIPQKLLDHSWKFFIVLVRFVASRSPNYIAISLYEVRAQR